MGERLRHPVPLANHVAKKRALYNSVYDSPACRAPTWKLYSPISTCPRYGGSGRASGTAQHQYRGRPARRGRQDAATAFFGEPGANRDGAARRWLSSLEEAAPPRKQIVSYCSFGRPINELDEFQKLG